MTQGTNNHEKIGSLEMQPYRVNEKRNPTKQIRKQIFILVMSLATTNCIKFHLKNLLVYHIEKSLGFDFLDEFKPVK